MPHPRLHEMVNWTSHDQTRPRMTNPFRLFLIPDESTGMDSEATFCLQLAGRQPLHRSPLLLTSPLLLCFVLVLCRRRRVSQRLSAACCNVHQAGPKRAEAAEGVGGSGSKHASGPDQPSRTWLCWGLCSVGLGRLLNSLPLCRPCMCTLSPCVPVRQTPLPPHLRLHIILRSNLATALDAPPLDIDDRTTAPAHTLPSFHFCSLFNFMQTPSGTVLPKTRSSLGPAIIRPL